MNWLTGEDVEDVEIWIPMRIPEEYVDIAVLLFPHPGARSMYEDIESHCTLDLWEQV